MKRNTGQSSETSVFLEDIMPRSRSQNWMKFLHCDPELSPSKGADIQHPMGQVRLINDLNTVDSRQ